MPKSLTIPQALIHTMITIAAVDRNISDNELRRIGSLVKDLPAFKDFDPDLLVEEAQSCGAELSKPNGLEVVLTRIYEALPVKLHETAYVLAADVAASDLRVKDEEIRFLEMLAEKLELDKLTCAALERAARARHQRA